MRPLPIYLNDLSCDFIGITNDAICSYVENVIDALVETNSIQGIAVRLPKALGEITLGNSHDMTLARVLAKRQDKMRVLSRLIDKSCKDETSEADEKVGYDKKYSFGMTRAHQNDSFVFSFGYTPHWSGDKIKAEKYPITQTGNSYTSPVEIRNLASSNNVNYWKNKIEEYGSDASMSSIIYKSSLYAIKMFCYDHSPPHIHVYKHSSDPQSFLAKIKIHNGEVMEGRMEKSLPELRSLIEKNKNQLLLSWEKCQRGELPLWIQM